jgi:hypothetical protein
MDTRVSKYQRKSLANIGLRLAFCLTIATVTAGCESRIEREAREAEEDGRVINNPMMSGTYPKSFKPGDPPYLERDFEAGVDFICDEINLKRGRDICSDEDINWR